MWSINLNLHFDSIYFSGHIGILFWLFHSCWISLGEIQTLRPAVVHTMTCQTQTEMVRRNQSDYFWPTQKNRFCYRLCLYFCFCLTKSAWVWHTGRTCNRICLHVWFGVTNALCVWKTSGFWLSLSLRRIFRRPKFRNHYRSYEKAFHTSHMNIVLMRCVKEQKVYD